MENNIHKLLSSSDTAHQGKKSTKFPNKTKKSINKQKPPVKVVYISNPMKVKTSASEFRALVQELTGQDAEFPDPTKFEAADKEEDYGTEDPTAKMGSEDHDVDLVVESSSTTTTSTTTPTSNNNTASYYEMFDDDVFMPQMMDSLSGIFPSTVWYDSPQVLDVIRSATLDASCDVN
ncbi:hypothetical protein CsatB_019711 [Cannabis sativa]|uniref:VQ domain-containing protein n=1 Tax=Cannabis sativa TaxID=3483 RepID=A0A803QPK7_CANSA|nr:sigma factor binding protein 2, chloroplastic isoform X1 [Cannabis sativa]